MSTLRPLRQLAVATLILATGTTFAADPPGTKPTADPLIANGDFETDANQDQWPDGWPKAGDNGAWVEEDGNHFLRLTSPAPGTMVMLYREIPIPKGVEAIELSWRQRIAGLKVGKQAWFDVRIMMEYMNAAREKVTPGPKVPYARKDTQGWEEKRLQFLVPEGATILKFMPALFQIDSGTWDVDDVIIQPTDPEPLRERAEAEALERQQKLAANAAARRAKAAERLQANGSLIPNGNFETDANGDGWPDQWGRPKLGGSWEVEADNHFLRLAATEPDRLIMLYQIYDLSAVEAVELTWRQRVTGLRKGKMPWFDARFLFEFKDAAGHNLQGKPSPAYTQKDTDGWVTRQTRFLVPPEAVALVVMPALFQADAGTFDIDDLTLAPTDPAPLLAAKEEARKIEAARFVPPEEANPANWPKMLKVVGNRLHDPDGNEVWLQGVNTGNLETLPHDQQVVKSAVVAIDEWQANCLRIPMKEEFWFGRSPYQKDGGAAYRETIDRIVTLAANRGAYVVIDLHRFRAPKPEHAEFWKDAAARYQDHPAVLFDLFNEPHDISWEIWKNGGWVGDPKGPDESAFLAETESKQNRGFESVGMQALVDAVRSTGAKNIVIAGGIFWCNDLTGIVNGYALEDRDGHGVMYSWHTYNWHPGWARILPVAEKHPIFLGEVGADIKKMGFVPADHQEDPYTFVPDMLGFIQQHRINWTAWCLHPSATPRLIQDWTYAPTPFWGDFARRALHGEAFTMANMR